MGQKETESLNNYQTILVVIDLGLWRLLENVHQDGGLCHLMLGIFLGHLVI